MGNNFSPSRNERKTVCLFNPSATSITFFPGKNGKMANSISSISVAASLNKLSHLGLEGSQCCSLYFSNRGLNTFQKTTYYKKCSNNVSSGQKLRSLRTIFLSLEKLPSLDTWKQMIVNYQMLHFLDLKEFQHDKCTLPRKLAPLTISNWKVMVFLEAAYRQLNVS